jgi:hypothetical protein|tara:strand:- start:988 stop:1233 length:246 start_codon:yes stop_codon:yes gene_type:complete
MKTETRTEIEAAVFRKLLNHLDSRKDVQNLELMNLSGFCRNCLAKWYSAEAVERGEQVTVDSAKEIVYGMTYGDWKENFQK